MLIHLILLLWDNQVLTLPEEKIPDFSVSLTVLGSVPDFKNNHLFMP